MSRYLEVTAENYVKRYTKMEKDLQKDGKVIFNGCSIVKDKLVTKDNNHYAYICILNIEGKEVTYIDNYIQTNRTDLKYKQYPMAFAIKKVLDFYCKD